MKILLPILILFACALSIFSQKNVSDLSPKHAAALAEFLKEYKDYEFLSEKSYAETDIKFMRESFGKSFRPAYKVGDFNNDKVQDFAIIVIKDEPPVKTEPDIKPHDLEYKIAVVIFNGKANSEYYKAFIKELSAPLACFIHISYEKKKRLYYGVAETSSGFFMTPAGTGYILEYDNP